jgi:Flp pilus assembly protein TadG
VTAFLSRIAADRRGGAAIEFALLAPAFLLMFIGVLQAGMAMQAYSSLRQASSDAARTVSVEYQTDNRLTNSQIRQLSASQATTSPYLLDAARLEITVQDATVQQIPNARELTLTYRYRIPSFIEFAGIEMPEISYTRPIFVSLAA